MDVSGILYAIFCHSDTSNQHEKKVCIDGNFLVRLVVSLIYSSNHEQSAHYQSCSCIVASLVRLVYFIQLAGYPPPDPRVFFWQVIPPPVMPWFTTLKPDSCLDPLYPLGDDRIICLSRCGMPPHLWPSFQKELPIANSCSHCCVQVLWRGQRICWDDAPQYQWRRIGHRQITLKTNMVSSSIKMIDNPDTKSDYETNTWISGGGKY